MPPGRWLLIESTTTVDTKADQYDAVAAYTVAEVRLLSVVGVAEGLTVLVIEGDGVGWFAYSSTSTDTGSATVIVASVAGVFVPFFSSRSSGADNA